MVFYFTATGNSLYVAKQLEEHPVSIPQAMRNQEISYKDETIGIVCPIYGSEPPYMVQEFLKKAAFETDYFYMIMTYGCSNGAAAQLIQKYAKECRIELSYLHTIKMVDNYLPGFDMAEEQKIDKKIDQQLSEILKDIKEKKRDLEETAAEDRKVYENYLAFTKEHPELGWKALKLEAAASCVGCGLCTKVCPAGCIQIENGKAIHMGENCQVCMACIHHCPKHAVRLSVPEQNPNARFCNAAVTVREIMDANCQL